MAFGFKVKSIKFNNPYTIQELFEEVKEKEFSAGKPELVKYMTSNVIVFPALDNHNQVQIMTMSQKKAGVKFVVQKGDELSLKSAVKGVVLSDLTNGLTGLGRALGKNSKACEKLVDETVKELQALNL